MRRDLAETLSKNLLECTVLLDRSLGAVKECGDLELFQACQQKIGQILGLFYVEILRDIFAEYPDLEPSSMQR